MLKETLRLLFLGALLESVSPRGCSSFFCRKSHRVSGSRFGVDPGKPLMLTPYLEEGKIEEAKKLSLVGPLPGANVKSYSGYLTVNKTYNSNLFFWFFPAQERPETAPVLLWLQGGPGGTSMFGLFVEHGPYFVHKNLTLGYRDFPWTSRYSVLYIDNPVGTGWSFTEDDRGFAQNQDDVGRDLYSALIQFFQIFSEFQSNPFYATGESYAGKYVPAIGYYIHKNNPSAKVKINFKGVAIGDGLCDPELVNENLASANHLHSAIVTSIACLFRFPNKIVLFDYDSSAGYSPEETEEPDRLELLDAAIASNLLNLPAYWRLLGLDSSSISVSALLTCLQLSRVPPKQPIISSCECRIRRESPALPHLQARVWQQKNRMMKLYS
uniref:Probable serine carboxypeptidase CPVL n=1 Tax=Sinocyclocheilus rhinocerous TaxID=307959 RepID=A0A673GZT9_9TELE